MPRTYIAAEVEKRVRAAARNRCDYCLSQQHLVMARLEIEHIIPIAQGGNSDESNLWLACPLCNRYKSEKISALDPDTNQVVRLFNPRSDDWVAHFRWSDDGLLVLGKTPIGRATIVALHLSDDPIALEVRKHWILAGWHPPQD